MAFLFYKCQIIDQIKKAACEGDLYIDYEVIYLAITNLFTQLRKL